MEVEMKAKLFRVTSILALVMAFTAVSAYGQSNVKRGTFVVPFDFNVGQKVLPAGVYTVSSESAVVRIQSKDHKQNLVALPYRIGSTSEPSAKLTFKRYGDTYYLSQVWLTDGIGRELKKHKPADIEVSMKFSTVEVTAVGR